MGFASWDDDFGVDFASDLDSVGRFGGGTSPLDSMRLCDIMAVPDSNNQ